MKEYEDNFLPGCGGSVDVVHLKWSCCPAGDFNRACGKEKFPSVAFECVTNNKRKILGVAPVQYGSRNDKHIVRIDPTVSKIINQWYRSVTWFYYTLTGEVKESRGIYLICDNGYLSWPSLICPFKGESITTRLGYFSENIESVRKDVECTFGILKKRWRILEYGIHFRNLELIESIFLTCCVLHNIMVDDPETVQNQTRVARGIPTGIDAIYIWDGSSDDSNTRARTNRSERRLTSQWNERRNILAEHLEYCRSIHRRSRI